MRVGVLVCASLGKEQAETTRWFKYFAERLAARECAVLRFDYPHTGESAGAQDAPGASRQWLEGIGAGVELLRSCGVPEVIGVGHRMGALMLSLVAAELSVHTMVLWDPVMRGRTYLRSKTVLYNMVGEIPDWLTPWAHASSEPVPQTDHRVHIAGQSLHPDAAQTLSSWKLDRLPESASAVLVLEREAGGPPSAVFDHASVDVVSIGDQEPFLEPGHPAVISFPERDVTTVVDWIDEHASESRISFSDPDIRQSAVVARTQDGRPVVNSVHVVDDGVMVWRTQMGGRAAPMDIFVAHSLGQYVRTGPSRLWFDTAIRVACSGGGAIRFDRPGVGESGMVSGADRMLPLYTQAYVDEGCGVLESLELPVAARLVHGGICVGSWMAAHGALATARTHPDRHSTVVLVNPLMWRLRPQRRFRLSDYGSDVGIAGVATAVSADATSRLDDAQQRLATLRNRIELRVRRRMPRRWWSVIPHLPDAALAQFAAEAVNVEMVFAPADYAYFNHLFGADATIRAAKQPPGVHIGVVGDHTSYNVVIRELIMDTVVAAVGSPGLPD
ncbi:hypothetical protein FOB84_18455 [Gordonia bronchialis]|uniref:hypothetical protein n=1 Tax=Gordonia bronchialis TaxID=2054 RepID=UPI000324AA4A|nr:hypothetical protein [Gordonia bronchialis]MCC3323165.1 hypothetical protein [Gordonia bronchialis]QGS25810.1 hypothetical protein FOB84_18455 [Gordonia bronchialis]UAK37791.1 hypothetical protein K8O93_22425 [Gordonia bronchialis]